ncbi:MAG: hypothetical protein M3O91_04560 [Chloroflexota bacterium]|nr:hypothetical protein [Chloroflexota bacterium]
MTVAPALQQPFGVKERRSWGPVLAAALAFGACGPTNTGSESSPSTVPATSAPRTAASAAASTAPPSASRVVLLEAPLPGEPTVTLYLPYLTKTLGGPAGWETPFIIQNADTFSTDLELSFYAISDGVLVARRIVRGLQPGASYADRPNHDPDLTDNAAYSGVVRSFGAKVVAVVNEQRGSGARFEADSYVGAFASLSTVFLPSVARRVDGFVSQIVVQNIGAQPTVASAAFLSTDGARTATLTRTIQPGRSALIDLAAEAALTDGVRYAARITASERVVAIVNSHRDEPTDGAPMLYAYNALLDGANTVFGPYAVKNVPGVGKGSSAVSVQNMARTAAQPSLTFTPLGGGSSTRFDGPTLAAGAPWSFDLRFRNGDPEQPICGAQPSAGCLGDGEYSFVGGAPGEQFAALVTVIGTTTAAAYAALTRPTAYFLPNVTRTLGGRDGWTTPIIVQSIDAGGLTLSWYRFSDGGLAVTQTLAATPGAALRIDPRDVAGLNEDAQYAVLVAGNGGRLVAVVTELNFSGGDGAAIYGGFSR